MRDADVLTVVGHRTVADVLRAGAERTPDRILLVFDALDGSVQEFTWKDVLERSSSIATGLAAAGVSPVTTSTCISPTGPSSSFTGSDVPCAAP